MALIKSMIGELRGKLGGQVFSRNKYGAYVRQKVSPVQPNSPRQTIQKNRQSYLSKHFMSELTPSQREGWELLAKNATFTNRFGDPLTLTSIALYIKVNQDRLTAALEILDDAPLNLDVVPVAGFGEIGIFDRGQPGARINWTFAPELPEDHNYIAEVGVSSNPNAKFMKNRFRFASTSNDGAAGEILFSQFAGDLPIGSRCALRVSSINTVNGARSSRYEYSGIVSESAIVSDIV